MQMKAVVYILTALIALSSTLDAVLGDSESHKMNKMAETLKMLQSLDKFYGQAARPRFGKRGDYPRLQDRLEEVMNEEMPDEQMWDPLR